MSMRKPTAAETPKKAAAERPKKSAVNRIINRGGSVATATHDSKKSVQLRVDPTLLDRIDSVRETIPASIRASRHTWMMEAILEKLEREEQ